MKTIILFCANGFSTIMMRDKIREAAKSGRLDYNVEAFPFAKIEEGSRADLILLAPQIRFNRKAVEKMYPEKKIVIVDIVAYGAMNGSAVLQEIQTTLGD